jgi:hypothetical protein
MPKLRPIFALAWVAACSASDPAVSQVAADLEGRCPAYPIPWPTDPGARDAAAAELATLSPTAVMTWNDARGALSNIAQLDVPLPGCTDGVDVNAEVRKFLADHPRLFQLDLDEWSTLPPFNCTFVPDGGLPADLTMARLRLAGHDVRHDIFDVAVKKIDGVVHMTSVTATYLPVAPKALDRQLTECVALHRGGAAAAVQATALEAPVFQGEVICQPTGTVSYSLRPDDSLSLSRDEWDWGEDASGVSLQATRTLRVTVDPRNDTPELLASGARCPVLDGPADAFTVGWDVLFDAHTGEILFVKPGLDCVVC